MRDPVEKRRIFAYAFKKSIPVMLGYVFLGMAYGIVLQKSGLGWPWALLISLGVYAGSMQFALVPLMSAMTPLPTVALMTLMVNCRHLFYGLPFVEKFRRMGKKAPYMIFSLTGETYSVLISCKDDPEAEDPDACFFIAALHHLYWVVGSVIGAAAGELIAFDTTGIDFAMTALFTVILVDQIRGGRAARSSAALGGGLAVAFLLLLGPENFLLPTLACTVAGLMLMNAAGKERA